MMSSSGSLEITIIIPMVVLVVLCGASIAGYMYHQKIKFERDLQLQLWRIPLQEIKVCKSGLHGSISQVLVCNLVEITPLIY